MYLLGYLLQWTLPLIATMTLLYLLAKPKSYAKNIPPGPNPLPIFGNLMGLLPYTTTPHKYFNELAKTHGPIMTLKLGSITAIVVSTTTFAKHVLLRNNHVSSTLYDLDAVKAHEHNIFSIGSLSATSPTWRILRKIYSTRLLSDKILESMQIHRHKMLQKLLCNIRQCSRANIVVDVGQTVHEASFDLMCSTIFSLDLSTDDRKIKEIFELMNCIVKEIGRPNIVDCYPFLRVVDPQCIRHRLTCYCAKLFKLFDEILEVRLKARKSQVNVSELYNDLLDVILEVMEEQGDQINRGHIHHLLLDLLGAGMDTTAKTIEWAMTELLRHPTVLHKLQQEIDGVVIRKGETDMLESTISQLPYMQAIITETLRLHPPAALLLPRKVEQDFEIDGYLLPKGSMLIVNAWAVGRDPLTWADPDSFFPERFLGSDFDVKSQVIKLFVFGAGKKMCPGISLALRWTSLVLGSLISSFDWKLEDHFGDLQQELNMDDYYGITIKKAKSLRAFAAERL